MIVPSEGSGEATSSSSEPTPLSEVLNPSESHAQASEDTDEEESTEEKGDQKFPAGEASSDEKSAKSEETDEKESPEPKSDSKEKVPAKSDSKEKEEKPSDDKAPKDKWDVEDNPFKKRFQDTASNWNKEHQEKLQLQQQMQQMQQDMVVLRKIADGTYDPEKDNPTAHITPEFVASKALEVGKAISSKHAAVAQYGQEKVDADLAEFHSLFGSNQQIQNLVLNHEAPVYEAFRILERYRFEKQYGDSPQKIRESIRAEYEKEMRETLKKEITDEIMGRVDKKKSHPSFSSSRGSNGLGKGAKPNRSGPTPLKDVFGR